MKAFVYDKKYPKKLVLKELDIPSPKENEVLIKVRTVSINAADYRSIKMGLKPKRKVFGSAVAGTIEKIGKEVIDYNIGDDVIVDLADFGFGGFAEYAIAPTSTIALKPNNISFEEAATLPVAATTALRAVKYKGDLQPNQKVMIVGASGGVGSFAIQMAKVLEGKVTGVCSSRNVDQTKELGAHQVIDYEKVNFMDDGQKYDLILAVNGDYSIVGFKKKLNPNGRFVVVGGSLKQIFKTIFFGWALSIGSKKIKFLSAKSNSNDLSEVGRLASKGKILPCIENIFRYSDTPLALSEIINGRARGKLVIKVC